MKKEEIDQTVIAYDDFSNPLHDEVERSIRSKLHLLLKKLDFGGRLLSILFCSTDVIQKLNFQYRGIDKPTDILSWLYGNEENDFCEGAANCMPWGELAICLKISKEQAQKSGWSHEVEIIRLLTHGLGHLMGYDHELSKAEEEKALRFEIELLSLIGLNKIYS